MTIVNETTIENDTTTEEVMFTTNSTIETGYFEKVFSYQALNPITICVFVIGLIVGMLGPLSVIWYERNCSNRFRTVVNQMLATWAWYLLARSGYLHS